MEKSTSMGDQAKRSGAHLNKNVYGLTTSGNICRQQKLIDLYNRLDSNSDGTIDVKDLTKSLQLEKPHIPHGLAKDLFHRMKAGSSETIDLADFMNYVNEQERRLEFIFSDLDRNKDGFIDWRELKQYCDDLEIPITNEKAEIIVQIMDQSGSAVVDLYKFKDFLMLYPSSDPKDIAKFWKHNLIIDIGEDSQVPEDFTQEELKAGIWWRHLVAGGIAGCMSRTCTAPLDRLKVYLQVYATKKNYISLRSAMKYLHKEGGIRSFWRGNGINVLKIGPESAIKFLTYEQMKVFIKRTANKDELHICERFIAGSTAGLFSQATIYPLEVLKTRLALRKSGQLNEGLLSFAKGMSKAEGWKCFYRGFTANTLGIIPYAGIDLAIYETLKRSYMEKNNSEPGVLALLGCGTLSSTCGQIASYPLALIRTRLQARVVSGNLEQPSTVRGQFRYIITNEGVSGLYRGVAPNFLKVAPAVGISYVVYEFIRKELGAKMS